MCIMRESFNIKIDEAAHSLLPGEDDQKGNNQKNASKHGNNCNGEFERLRMAGVMGGLGVLSGGSIVSFSSLFESVTPKYP